MVQGGYVEIAGRRSSEAEADLEAAAVAPLSFVATGPRTPVVAPAASGVGATAARPAAATVPAESVARVPALTPPTGSIDDQLAAAGKLLSDGAYEEALDRLDRLYRQHPSNDALRRLTAEAEACFVDRAYRHWVPPDWVPSLVQPMDRIASQSLSPHEFFLLSRIDGSWDVKSIIQVAPLREVEALRTLKRMREMGMIELHAPE
jgi:hypothetical protein